MNARPRSDRGFIAIEFIGAVALLLLPVVMLVASLPRWTEREHAATVVAREVAREAARVWPNDIGSAGDHLAREIAANFGVDANTLTVRIVADDVRGGQIRVTATVVMPAIAVPGIGTAGQWRWSTTAAVRIDDFRSR